MRIDPKQPWHPVYLFQPLYNIVLMGLFEWGVALHDLDFDAIRKGTKSKRQVKRRAEGDRPQGASADPQGLRRLPRAVRFGVAQDARRQRDRQRGPQRLVARDHLLRPLPGPGVHLHRGRGRQRDAAAGGMCGSCSARRTSTARRPSTSWPATCRSRWNTTCTRTCRARDTQEIAPRVKRGLREVRAAVQHRAVPQAVGLRAALDRATGIPWRRASDPSRRRTWRPRWTRSSSG